MIYKIHEVCNIESFNPNKILRDLFERRSSIVVVLTEKIENYKFNYHFLTRKQIQYCENLAILNDRINYLISHSIVNIFYCKLMGCSIDKLNYYYNLYRKPHIKNKSNINFNISHTLGCTVIAFSYKNIGIDVENIERKVEFENIIDYYFSDFEKIHINNKSINFFKFWVAKEAYLKCIGCGLVKGLNNANINVTDTDYCEILNKDTYLRCRIQIKHIYSRYIIGVTTLEVKDEQYKKART